ncbi:MAG TPA: glycosyltransferase [Gemmatimonadaceae bacterium]|nr:glycosyltransferase [Gemmatimonadaceae bacterium]
MLAGIFSHHALGIAVAAAVPWIVIPWLILARWSRSQSLDEESPRATDDAPLVSIIIPARNEAHNIAACVRTVLASTYPRLEVIVVDDHSTDGTGKIARAIAETDVRMRVIDNPDLPGGWFGKQWACQNGAYAAQGAILIFVDADTRLGTDLVTRSVNGMQRTQADLYTVLGRQAMESFWERLVQPQIFTLLWARYGGTEWINGSARVADKIANGQYLMIRRTAYDAMQGHALVRAFVAEDLMLAQRYFAAGRTTVVALGLQQLSTRMYTSLGELVQGWGKNVFAAGREAVPFGKMGQLIFPFVLLAMPILQLVPVVTVLAALTGIIVGAGVTWAVIATLALLVWWAFVYWFEGQRIVYAVCFPLGAIVVLYIFVSAIVRGRRVSWKGRRYVSTAVMGG